MVNLFENYGEVEGDLVHSLKCAGYDHLTVVLNEDGFLPEGVTSPVSFFTGLENRKLKGDTRARFFNELTLPNYWEIKGSNSKADIWEGFKKKGDIQFSNRTGDFRKIKEVTWLNDFEQVRAIDLYDQTGEFFGRHTFSDGSHVLTSYFDQEGREVVLVNHLLDTIQVYYKRKNHLFKSYTAFILFYFEVAGINAQEMYYNSLGRPFFISNALKEADPQRDFHHTLFWQEESNEMPGNMVSILEDKESPTKAIVVQNKAEYGRLASVYPSSSQVSLHYLGFNYAFKKSPEDRPSAFIHTNSDQILHLEELVKALPDVHFNISARTEMSSKLMVLEVLDNVTLYQSISNKELEEQLLINRCYLDINQGGEVDNIVRQAFENNLLLLGFESTLHNRKFIAPDCRFEEEDVSSFTQVVSQMMTNFVSYQEALAHQHTFAGLSTVEEYKKVLGHD